jgi:hypothetical protein
MNDADKQKPKHNSQIYNFVNWELQFLREQCNFTPDELDYFNLRAKHYSNLQIAIEMNVSEGKVAVLAKKVKTKILKVLS